MYKQVMCTIGYLSWHTCIDVYHIIYEHNQL